MEMDWYWLSNAYWKRWQKWLFFVSWIGWKSVLSILFSLTLKMVEILLFFFMLVVSQYILFLSKGEYTKKVILILMEALQPKLANLFLFSSGWLQANFDCYFFLWKNQRCALLFLPIFWQDELLGHPWWNSERTLRPVKWNHNLVGRAGRPLLCRCDGFLIFFVGCEWRSIW